MTYDITDATETATYIADWALMQSTAPKWASPYMMRVKEAGRNFIGGKKDNITVVCAQIHTDGSEAPVREVDIMTNRIRMEQYKNKEEVIKKLKPEEDVPADFFRLRAPPDRPNFLNTEEDQKEMPEYGSDGRVIVKPKVKMLIIYPPTEGKDVVDKIKGILDQLPLNFNEYVDSYEIVTSVEEYDALPEETKGSFDVLVP